VQSVVKKVPFFNLLLKSPPVISLGEGVEPGSFLFRKIGLDALESLSTEIFEAIDRSKSQDLDLMRRGRKFVMNHLSLGIIKVQLADPLSLQFGGYLIGISRQIRRYVQCLFQSMPDKEIGSGHSEDCASDKNQANHDGQTKKSHCPGKSGCDRWFIDWLKGKELDLKGSWARP
jgi:hypothetical protein